MPNWFQIRCVVLLTWGQVEWFLGSGTRLSTLGSGSEHGRFVWRSQLFLIDSTKTKDKYRTHSKCYLTGALLKLFYATHLYSKPLNLITAWRILSPLGNFLIPGPPSHQVYTVKVMLIKSFITNEPNEHTYMHTHIGKVYPSVTRSKFDSVEKSSIVMSLFLCSFLFCAHILHFFGESLFLWCPHLIANMPLFKHTRGLERWLSEQSARTHKNWRQ